MGRFLEKNRGGSDAFSFSLLVADFHSLDLSLASALAWFFCLSSVLLIV